MSKSLIKVRVAAKPSRTQPVAQAPKAAPPKPVKKDAASKPVLPVRPALLEYDRARTNFDTQVARFMGDAFKRSMSIDLEAAYWLVEECKRMAPATILEFGSGFSTVAFASYLKLNPSCSMFSLDHNKAWMKFVSEQIDPKVSQGIHWLSIDEFIASGRRLELDMTTLAFIDSGPTYHSRCEHVMFTVGLLRRGGGGLLVLDDYHADRKRRRMYTDIIVPRLKDAGIDLELVPTTGPPHSRRYTAWAKIPPRREPDGLR